MYKLVLWIFLYCIPEYEGARILAVFPTPSISHQVAFRPLTQELVKRGHEIVVITTDPAFPAGEKPENLTEIDVHDVSYKIWHKEISSIAFGDKRSLEDQLYVILQTILKVFVTQMNVEEVQQIIKKKTKPFDLILVEAYVLPTLGFSHVYKVPVIQVSSFLPVFTDIQNVGAPDHPLIYPVFGRESDNLDNLSVVEKIKLFYDYFHRDVQGYEAILDKIIKLTFGPSVPRITKLYNNIAMLFLNTFPIWDSNRPVPPNVQYIGGLHMTKPKELPQDLKTYLDSSKHGVIYLSFGTNVVPSTLSTKKMQIFLNVLSRLPYDVLLKWDKDELPCRTNNIKIFKWLPQSDLMKHPKIKLFITQGGLQSTDEAIAAGVPLLGIPMLADQWYNVAMYERHNIGVKLDMDNITEDNFEAAINTLTKDDTYRQNVMEFRSILYDQPQTSLERAVWWTEHVLRHGGARHLRTPAANLPWTTYYEVELLVTLFLATIPALWFLKMLMFRILRYFTK